MAELAAGAELAGRFRLKALQGRGGSAEVWVATDTLSGHEVALRVLAAPDEAAAAALAAGLEDDAARLRGLVHPGILRPLNVVVDGTRVAVAFDLADGGDLGALRGAGHQAIVATIREVADALQYVHAQGLTHGDLKPGNILRDRQGRWRLTDFRSGALPDGNEPVSLSTISPQQLAGAAPTTADDIYSLGAVLYDLLAGHPRLHPGITAERIGREVPARLGVDGQGQSLPVALVQLVAAMLANSPALRPGSLGAVRTLLEESATEPVPAPLQPAPAAAGAEAPRRRTPPPPPGGSSPRLVAGALLALLAAVLAVVFWLPRVVSERGPLVRSTPPALLPAPPPAGQPPPTAPAPDARALAEAAFAERRRAEAAAEAAAADQWGGAGWQEARRLAGLGDGQFRQRDFAAAAASFRQAADRFQALADGAGAAFAAALETGRAALARADQRAAVAAFERALLIRPGDAAAVRGLARSRQLDAVLAAMTAAAAREASGDLAAARAGYAATLKLDADWAPARAAIARLDAGRVARDFETAMAEGVGALAAGRLPAARGALQRALALRPGDAGARSALEQLAGDERRGRLAGLQAEALRLVAAERWAEAAAQYREMLAVDATLAAAKDGLAASEVRGGLHRRLEQQLANADRFNDDTVAAGAQALVREAEAVAAPGPVLAGQVTRLRELLAVAARPVRVQLESDNLTNVVIYKVGDLGAFASRTVELRPGSYVIVGTRVGYRDVRRTVRIDGDGTREPISVRCEEPI